LTEAKDLRDFGRYAGDMQAFSGNARWLFLKEQCPGLS
jgi:hypothetical protein